MIRKYNNIDLQAMNTFAIKVKCDKLIEFDSVEDLGEVFSESNLGQSKWNVLSGGSNILFSSDFDGVLLHPTDDSIEIKEEQADDVRVRVGAGVVWDDFVAWAVERELWGAENLSDIPGYVGAAPVQNIGAYGVEVKDVIESVEMYVVESDSKLTLAKEHCGFGYRDSTFKRALKGKVIITSVNFILSCKEQPSVGYGDLRDKIDEMGGVSLQNIRNAVIAIRNSKLPDPKQMGNAGSFFKNPIVEDSIAKSLKEQYESMPVYPSAVQGESKLAAGWLIDQCGWKGRRVGRVGVHERQALVIVNHGGATGEEVLKLAQMIRDDVRSRFGVELDMEVNVF